MALSTFAALLLAHVIADYLLQTRWLVDNKHRAQAISLHIAAVFLALPLVTLDLSPWFLAVAALHLAIDLTKTHLMRPGLPAYVADQFLHIVSLVLVTSLVPDLWAASPLAGVEGVARGYLIVALLILAARGGQFAVTSLPGACDDAEDGGAEVLTGWIERGALVAAVAMGAPWAIAGVLAASAAGTAWASRRHPPEARGRMTAARGLSLIWGLACAAALFVLLPSLG